MSTRRSADRLAHAAPSSFERCHLKSSGLAVAKLFLALSQNVPRRNSRHRKDDPRVCHNGIGRAFVGSLSPHHPGRHAWLEKLCREVPLQDWGPGVEKLAAESPIRKAYRGPAWGLSMYRILRGSRISVNYHIELSGEYANNMRLYETTGVGTLLLTDWKRNLHELFEPEVEVVTYRTPEECVEKIRYFLEHEEERARIAKAGQARTLRDHTYRSRMAELVALTEGLIPG